MKSFSLKWWNHSIIDKLVAGKRIAILAGAGVSLDAPSNLIDGRTFVHEVVTRVIPDTVPKEWFMAQIDFPTNREHRPGEMERFEQLMMSLAETMDPSLSVLDCLNLAKEPNSLHFFLAQAIRDGHVVMTTNFDDLIERAYSRLCLLQEKPLQVIAYNEQFPDRLSKANGESFLWKLHGSLTINGRTTRDSLLTTFSSVMSSLRHSNKYQWLEDVLRELDILIMGYSGMDDFDIIPVISSTMSRKALVWIDHRAPGSDVIEVGGKELREKLAGRWEEDLIGCDRVMFNKARDLGFKPRSTSKIALLRGNTAEIVLLLADRLFPDRLKTPKLGSECPFGKSYPDETREFFDDWFNRLSFGESWRWQFALSCTQLMESRPYSESDIVIRDQIQQGYMESLNRKGRLPSEELQLLVEQFNQIDPRQDDFDLLIDELTQLSQSLSKLLPNLPESSLALGLRLQGLICSKRFIIGEAAIQFRKSIEVAKKNQQFAQELESIKCLIGVYKYLDWNDEIPQLQSRYEYLIELTGHYTTQAMADNSEPFEAIFEKYGLQGLIRVMTRNRRLAVDAGDVVGEAQATYRLAWAFWEAGRDSKARLELIRFNLLLDFIGPAATRDEFSFNQIPIIQERVSKGLNHSNLLWGDNTTGAITQQPLRGIIDHSKLLRDVNATEKLRANLKQSMFRRGYL